MKGSGGRFFQFVTEARFRYVGLWIAATKNQEQALQSKPRRAFLGAVRGCRPLGQSPLVLSISNALCATGLPPLAALREQYPR